MISFDPAVAGEIESVRHYGDDRALPCPSTFPRGRFGLSGTRSSSTRGVHLYGVSGRLYRLAWTGKKEPPIAIAAFLYAGSRPTDAFGSANGNRTRVLRLRISRPISKPQAHVIPELNSSGVYFSP